MRASESPFQSYKSKQILLFAILFCSSASRPKALKITCLRFAILSNNNNNNNDDNNNDDDDDDDAKE